MKYLLTFLLLVSASAYGQVAPFVFVPSGTVVPTVVATLDTAMDSCPARLAVPFTVPSGNNRYLIVATYQYGSTGTAYVHDVTFNDVSMTSLDTIYSPDNTSKVQIFGMIAPTEIADSVIIPMGSGNRFSAAVVSFTNVDQSTPYTGLTGGTDSTAEMGGTVTSASGSVVLDFAGHRGAYACENITDGANQTRLTCERSPDSYISSASSTKAGAASTAMSWTFAAARRWVWAGLSLDPP